jgi:hypothetical protein
MLASRRTPHKVLFVIHHMAELPDRTNFYSSVQTDLQPEAVARLFAPPVWSVRKCSWTDFEAVSEFAEVVIESSNPVLVHGPVADVTVNGRRIVEPLVAAGLSGSFECYDEVHTLILEKAFGTPGGGG